MARGRFGHHRATGSNLTALINSLYQQQRAAEDRVMFDAYQNGGKGLSGKPVTDQAMRAYMKQRQAGFTKDDPLYVEWGDRITQLDFKIGEDKVTLAYQQGHVGAGAVAAFYRHQLSTIPQNSAFYRTVAGRAAQWAKAAAGAARAAAGARLTKALEAKQKAVGETWDRYSNLVGVLTDAAKRAGLIAGNQTLTDADATDLQAFLAHGVAGPHGTTITFKDWQHATLDAYRGFDTLIGINKQLKRGTKELTDQKGKFLDQNLVRINTIDDRAKYEIARDAFGQATKDAGGDPRAVLAAADAYAKTLGTIRDNALKGAGVKGNDPEFLGGLANEIQALTTGKSNGGSTVYDLQSTTTEATPSTDLNDTAASIAKAQGDVKALADGSAYFGQDKFGGQIGVQYFPAGAALDPTGTNGLGAGVQPAVSVINGVPTKVMLVGHPVNAVGLTDAAGQAVETVPIGGVQVPIANLTASQVQDLISKGYKVAGDPATLGYVFSEPDGKTIKYGVIQPDGTMHFSTTNPFGEGLNASGNGDSFTVFAGAAVNASGQVQPDINTVPIVKGGATYLADESVTPKDLLNLASVAATPSEAAALTAEADSRTKSSAAERDYQNRKPAQDSPGFLGGVINLALDGVTNLVRSATSPALKGDGSSEGIGSPMTLALPSLKPFQAPTIAAPKIASAPTVAPAPTAPTTTPTVPSAGKTKDDITNVSDASAPTLGGSLLGQTSADLLNKLTNPTTTGHQQRAL